MSYAHDATSAGVNGPVSNPETLAHTCGAGADLLVVCIDVQFAPFEPVAGTVTYNSVSMTKAGSTQNYDNIHSQIWYLLNPDTGSSYNVSVPTANSSMTMRITAISFTCTGTAQYDAAGGGDGATNSISNSLSVAGAGVVVDCAAHERHETGGVSLTTSPSGIGETEVGLTDEGAWSTCQGYAFPTGSGSVTMTWETWGGADDWCHAMASFDEAGGGGSVVPIIMGVHAA